MSGSPSFGQFALRVTACQIVTYFVAGLGPYTFLDYRGQFLSHALSCFMLPVDAPIVALGPILQVFRGLIFAAALFPFRQVFLATPRGWLLLWGLMVGLAVLSPTGPAPASVEGFIYTKIPISQQVLGYFEVLPQTLAFSFLVVALEPPSQPRVDGGDGGADGGRGADERVGLSRSDGKDRHALALLPAVAGDPAIRFGRRGYSRAGHVALPGLRDIAPQHRRTAAPDCSTGALQHRRTALGCRHHRQNQRRGMLGVVIDGVGR